MINYSVFRSSFAELFYKDTGMKDTNFVEKRLRQRGFLWRYRNSSEHFLKEHLPATFSEGWSKMPRMLFFPMDLAHLFTRGFLPACSRLTRKTLEKGVKELRSKFTIKNRATSFWYCSGVFIVDFEHRPATLLKKRPWHILHLFLVFLLLTLNS